MKNVMTITQSLGMVAVLTVLEKQTTTVMQLMETVLQIVSLPAETGSTNRPLVKHVMTETITTVMDVLKHARLRPQTMDARMLLGPNPLAIFFAEIVLTIQAEEKLVMTVIKTTVMDAVHHVLSRQTITVLIILLEQLILAAIIAGMERLITQSPMKPVTMETETMAMDVMIPVKLKIFGNALVEVYLLLQPVSKFVETVLKAAQNHVMTITTTMAMVAQVHVQLSPVMNVL